MRLCLEEKVKENDPYLKHLATSADLVTTYEATRAGFVALALEKKGNCPVQSSRLSESQESNIAGNTQKPENG